MDIYAVTSQEILERLSRHCPEALSTYFQCINRAGKDGQVFFSKQLVDVDMSENWGHFRNNIKKLAKENLLQWHPFDKGIAITLTEVSDDE